MSGSALRSCAICIALLGACGGGGGGDQKGDAGSAGGDGGGPKTERSPDAAPSDASVSPDAPVADGSPASDAAPVDGEVGAPDGGEESAEVFGVAISVATTCEVTTEPASISVPAGTEFTVDWIHDGSSSAPVDVTKIDPFNQVPIVIDLQPGQSYHDTVREWCGEIFTGTFSFRITGCHEPYFLDVDCGG